MWYRFSVLGLVFNLFINVLGDNMKDIHITFVDELKVGRIIKNRLTAFFLVLALQGQIKKGVELSKCLGRDIR